MPDAHAEEVFTTSFQAGPIASEDVLRFRLTRRLGRVAEAEVDVFAPGTVEADDLLGQMARLAFGRGSGDAEHNFDGVVMGVTLIASPDDADEDRGCVHRLHVTSLMGLLGQQVDCRIFQDKDVKEIVTLVLSELGVPEGHQSWRLMGSYPKREYCVQYRESALAFACRLLEEEGIYWFSDRNDAGELIVFEDDSTSADPIDGDEAVPYRQGAGLEKGTDAIGFITERHRTATGKVVLRDYDFKKPEVDLTASASADRDADLERYDYPGAYVDPAVGKRLATVRLEALQAERVTLDVRAGCARVVPGRWLSIVDAPAGMDGDHFVTSAVHEWAGGTYVVHATLIPKKVKYRTPQLTPRPVIDGPQTAVIVAPPGSPTEEIHTDELARCKVRFHWDRYGKADDTATFWMRVSQAQTSGSMILPRLGWEVIVEFLEGNPDRPIITGRVFNGIFMPPYALPEGKSRTALQSVSSPGGGGKNEIRFEDKAGSEEVKIGAHKDTTLATANNKTKSTAVNETKNVKVDVQLTVGANQTVKVTNGYQNTVAGAQTVDVGGSRKVEVNAVYGLTSGGASKTSVGAAQMEMDGNPIQALLQLAVKAATEAAQAEATKALGKLDEAVSSKVDQVMGPINKLQGQVQAVGAGMAAVSNGDLGAAGSALSAAATLPSAGGFGAVLAGGSAAQATGLDALVHGAIASGGGALGAALAGGGGGAAGSSAANAGGPAGAVGANSAAESGTGPGWAVNICSDTHSEKVGSIKATIAAAGIHTTVKGARKHEVGAARVELVAGTRAESCLADKKETALGLVVLSKAPESETVGGARTTMVGGAVLEKIGASHTTTATGKAMFVGAFHKIDASTSIVFKCGDSEVVIDGGGVAIKSALVTITAPKVTLTSSVAEA
jgi:type VI secretion system secreted protein VgrG